MLISLVFGRKDVFIKSFRFLLTFNEPELGIADIDMIEDHTSDSNFDMCKYTEASEKLSDKKDTKNKAFDFSSIDFAQTIQFEEEQKPKLESKEGLLQVKDDLDLDDLDYFFLKHK